VHGALSSEFRLARAAATTSSTPDKGGKRNMVIGISIPPTRSRATFSRRESESETTPPRSMAFATSALPHTPLVTPETSMSCSAHKATTVRALPSMTSRSIER
jgi:hypothetical protein